MSWEHMFAYSSDGSSASSREAGYVGSTVRRQFVALLITFYAPIV